MQSEFQTDYHSRNGCSFLHPQQSDQIQKNIKWHKDKKVHHNVLKSQYHLKEVERLCICHENRNKTHFSSYCEILRFSLRALCYKIYIFFSVFIVIYSLLQLLCFNFYLSPFLIFAATFPIDVCYYCAFFAF